jgi:ABC-type transport system involved in cytochrome c biogenesis permease subunit
MVTALGVCYVGWLLLPPSAPGPKDFDYAGFGAIPVLHNGRVKPMDTVARSYLVLLTHKQTFMEEIDTGKKDEHGKPVVEEKRRPAIRWLLDAMTAMAFWSRDRDKESDAQTFGGPAVTHKVFRIESDEVLSLLGLPQRPGFWRYSVEEIRPRIGELTTQAQRAHKLQQDKSKKLTPYDLKVLELANDLQIFQQLAQNQVPQGIPLNGRPSEQWRPVDDVIQAGVSYIKGDPLAMSMVQMLLAYRNDDPQTFNAELRKLQDSIKKDYPAEASSVAFELTFNRFEPFHQATVLYIIAILLGVLSWLILPWPGWSRSFRLAAFWLTVLAFVVHSWALIARMEILGRPPVINLYSSAVFVGWCCIGVCLFMELVYRNCIPLVVGTVLASVTGGLIGHYLSLDGDTLEMLQAVLDTNFWLATHVTTVVFGYGATMVAGFIGCFYVLLRGTTALRIVYALLCTLLFGFFLGFVAAAIAAVIGTVVVCVGLFMSFQEEDAQVVAKMIYGVVCFATLLSFTGTVLGGIWADQSWGRFWGWDPKENGALLIVIWNALILHARWGGMIKQRGLALLTIAGNAVTAWSWFGTNLLGVGLHAYGFKSGTKDALIAFALSQIALICLSLVPPKYWLSFQKSGTPTKSGGGVPTPNGALPRAAVSTSS